MKNIIKKLGKEKKISVGILIVGIVLALILIFTNLAPKEQPTKISEETIKERERLVNEFKAKYEGNWSISWNDETNTPDEIRGPHISLYNESGLPLDYQNNESFIKELARDFILENKELLGVNEENNPKLDIISRGEDGWLVGSKQYYKDIPVYHSSGVYIPTLAISITEDLKLRSSRSDFYRGVKDIPIIPQLSDSKVIESANKQFGEEGVVDNISLAILPVKKGNKFDYRLAQRIKLGSKHFSRQWEYFVDAETGEILKSANLVKSEPCTRIAQDVLAKPVIAIYSPISKAYYKNEKITIKFRSIDTCDPIDVAHLDGVRVRNGDNINLSNLGAGAHTLTVRAMDHAENIAIKSVIFYVK